jgi:hypothetical protein
MNVYLVFSTSATKPIALLVTTTVSVFGFKLQCYSCSVTVGNLHRAETVIDSLTLATNGPYQAHSLGGGG